jgi:hypothetical protein
MNHIFSHIFAHRILYPEETIRRMCMLCLCPPLVVSSSMHHSILIITPCDSLGVIALWFHVLTAVKMCFYDSLRVSETVALIKAILCSGAPNIGGVSSHGSMVCTDLTLVSSFDRVNVQRLRFFVLQSLTTYQAPCAGLLSRASYGNTALPQCMLCINRLRASCWLHCVQPLWKHCNVVQPCSEVKVRNKA